MASSRNRGGCGHPDDGTVGYCRPPEEHRFRKGEPSRNPHGRRGKPRDPDDARDRTPDFLDGTVTVTVDGRPTRMTRDAALDHALFSRALKGDNGATRQLDRRRDERARRQATRTAHAIPSDADASVDAEIIAQALARRTSTMRSVDPNFGSKPDAIAAVVASPDANPGTRGSEA